MLSDLILLIVATSLVTLVNCEGDRARRGFEDAKGNSADIPDCEPGTASNGNDACVLCGGGFYADTTLKSCVPCPFDMYSLDGDKGNTECTPCPDNKKTRDLGTSNVDLCTHDVCEIPLTTRAYYQHGKTSAYLDANTRVYGGVEIVLQCMDEGYTIVDTELSYLTMTCTRSFSSSPLPSKCEPSKYEPEKKSGLICYDSCYSETSGDITRLVKLVGNGKVTLDTCPVAECEAEHDMCVTVSYMNEDIKTIHYSCQTSTLFDNEICQESGAKRQCSVKRCTTKKCNKPAKDSTSKTSGLSGTVLLTISSLVILLSWP